MVSSCVRSLFTISGVLIFEFCSLCSLSVLFLSLSIYLSLSIFLLICLACICSPLVSKGEGASSADLGDCLVRGPFTSLPSPHKGQNTCGIFAGASTGAPTNQTEIPKSLEFSFFSLQPPPPPIPTNPPGRPTPEGLISVHFGSISVRFGSVWLCLAPFRVCFGSVSGPFRGAGWGRGGVGERDFCKGKEYHYPKVSKRSSRASRPGVSKRAKKCPKGPVKEPKRCQVQRRHSF